MDAMTEAGADRQVREKLLELIGEYRIAMVTTVEEDGSLRARPMAPERLEDDPEHLYFVVRRSSHKTVELAADPHVGIGFSKAGEYLSVSGRARIVTDKAVIEALWSEPQRLWFPDGPSDPDIAALKISLDYGEYWERDGGVASLAYGWAKAVATGRSVEGQLGENEKIGHPG